MTAINYLGKELNSKWFDGNVDLKKVKYIQDNYYKEDKELALAQLKQVLLEHKSKNNHIYGYYFERVANDTVMGHDKWSINEILQSNEIVQTFINRTTGSPKVYPNPDDLLGNFKTSIRLGGKGICRKPTQFPIKVMRQILDDFVQPGDVYYDPCAGWGMRMLCAAEYDLKYIANDVNMDLLAKLKELAMDIKTIKPNFTGKLIAKGSENYIESLKDSVDFIFTSPPYFNLEMYGGNNDLRTFTYGQWLDTFVTPLLENCYDYIKKGKYVLINIKNINDYPLYDDFIMVAQHIGFELIGERPLKQANRTHRVNTHGDSSEKIMVLRKG